MQSFRDVRPAKLRQRQIIYGGNDRKSAGRIFRDVLRRTGGQHSSSWEVVQPASSILTVSSVPTGYVEATTLATVATWQIGSTVFKSKRAFGSSYVAVAASSSLSAWIATS